MKTVIFICVHNAGRSQMAEAFFNHMAKGQAVAISAGSRPADRVNPIVVAALREKGLEVSHPIPRVLTPELLESVDRAVSMGCEEDVAFPAARVKTEDWGLDDPAGKPIETVCRIRDEIQHKVEKLIQDMGLQD